MLGRNLGLVAASTLGASAFLIPAGIAPSDDKAIDFVPFSVLNPKHQILRLPCSACLFPYEKDEAVKEESENLEDSWFHIQSASNDLILNFTITDAQTLELNDAPIWPITPDYELSLIYLEQIPSSASDVDFENGEADRMSLVVDRHSTEIHVNGNGVTEDSVVAINFTPLSVRGQQLSLDAVTVELLQTVEGELLILGVSRTPRAFPQGLPFFEPSVVGEVEDVEYVEDKHCGPFCRFKDAVESKINDLKSFAHGKKPGKKPGCGGRRRPFPGGKLPSHIKPGFLHPEVQEHAEQDDQPGPPFFHGGRPHHFGHPHGHHRHHRHHGFFHYFVRGALAVAVPILAGVAVGMFISVASLLIGRFVSFLWTKFVRGGRRGYESVSLDDDECTLGATEVSDEKVVYVAEADLEAPPVYENAPAYEEVNKSEQ